MREIDLLQVQLSRLGAPNFDLEAWKNQTIIFLERIYGNESSPVKLIRSLHYDYSSWNLRDSSGAGSSKDPVKLQARAILEATIEELEKLGVPGNTPAPDRVWILLQEELTGKQLKQLELLTSSDTPDRQERISKMLEALDKESLTQLVAKLLLS